MSEIIESDDRANDSIVRIENSNTQLSIKQYQDIYHQITGRTENIRQRYSENLKIDFSEIEQLHFKVMQLCDVHNVVAKNETVSIFHEKERKEQFTSFERFKTYNRNTTKPTVNVHLKYNFSIILPGTNKPQEYVVSIRLTSRLAMNKQMEEEVPPYLRGRYFGFSTRHIAEISVDYADYVVASPNFS